MRRPFHFALLLAACSSAVFAQVQLFQVSGGAAQPVAPIFSFGTIDAGDSAAVSFRLLNTGAASAPVAALAVLGTGFVLVAPPPPASLDPQASFDFVVSFQPPAAGSYSATLQAAGVSVLLTGSATPALTYQWIGPAGTQPLNGPLYFGAVTLGSSAALRVSAVNQTGQPLLVPAIVVSGGDFALAGTSPSGTLLQPLDSAAFSIVFTPSQPAARSGSLAIGTHTFALSGTGQAPTLPKASLSLNLAQAGSAQQGTIAVTLDSASPTAASGTIAMSFTPAAGIPAAAAADPAIGFAAGGLTATFTVAAGDNRTYFGVQPSAPFATGTTAGTINFTLAFGGATAQQAVTVAPAAAGLTAVAATRQSGAITVQATGFDNTRSAGKLSFTFYDASGNPISPGAIAADATTGFASYFGTSGLGGVFALNAVFPVTGSPSQVAAFDFQISNSAGTTRSARTSF
jgi:hypothetical protein